jgi:CMP-N-acetylneuraminic acid synthetase
MEAILKLENEPSVTVYVLSYNYGRFLADAIESVRSQVFADWELIVLDLGSTDDTEAVLDRFREDPRIRILASEGEQGLRRSANRCIRESRGKYVLRLDADDLLHPHCLDVYWREAARSPHVGLLFSDYYYIDEAGEILGVEAFRDGERAVTFPPHGSGSFVRRDTFDRIGFYDETLDREVSWAAGHGQELWLKVRQAGVAVQHIALPLFLYRQHGPSVSSDAGRLVRAQGAVKRRLARDLAAAERIVAVIPVRTAHAEVSDLPLMTLDGTTLLERAVRAAEQTPSVSHTVVTTDSSDIAEFMAEHFPDVQTSLRAPALRAATTPIRSVLQDVVSRAGLSDEVILCVLSVNTPRRTSFHVQKAIDNFLLYDVDSVVAVHEERNPIYQMGSVGLRAVNPTFHNSQLRREREAVYIDVGAIRVFRAGNLHESAFMGTRIGHSLMPREANIQVETPADVELLDGSAMEADQQR